MPKAPPRDRCQKMPAALAKPEKPVHDCCIGTRAVTGTEGRSEIGTWKVWEASCSSIQSYLAHCISL